MRYRTRAFLVSFVPLAFLLTAGFWTLQRLVESAVVEGLRSSLRDKHASMMRLRGRSEMRDSRFLNIAGENATLKAGLQLLLTYPDNTSARQTVEDQLQELCSEMGFDFLLVSDSGGNALAGVIRQSGGLVRLEAPPANLPRHGLITVANSVYQVESVPVDQGDQNLGLLAVGELFDVGETTMPAVLLFDGKVVESSLGAVPAGEITKALTACARNAECNVRIANRNYLSLPVESAPFGERFTLRSFEDIDTASAPLRALLGNVFVFGFLGVGGAALLFSLFSARSIVKPIAAIVGQLRESERTGTLPRFGNDLSRITEIRELTASFNGAAAAVRDARESLEHAYVEFVGTLANALDARDRYTAGHSRRVSELSFATAVELGAEPEVLEEVRVGALLHDIGKIGIADAVLQKPGRLTSEEFAIVKQHPEIGRRILEGVHGFGRYLHAVEFHHENWDGSGYPSGRRGPETPLVARIIHVADAYDAMTTDRPYRRGMTHEQAVSIILENAGSLFDPQVVDAFLKAVRQASLERETEYAGAA